MELSVDLERLAELTNWSELWTDAERAAILAEMNRILTDPAFSGSRRCRAMLLHLVEHTVRGDQDRLKERTLGIEVFGRSPDYDTAADPVVRKTASEIRKRLAQLYQGADEYPPVRISLDAGAYLPRFEFAEPERHEGFRESVPVPLPQEDLPRTAVGPGIEAAAETMTPARSGQWLYWLALAFVLIPAAGFAGLHYRAVHAKDYLIWKPLLDSAQPLTLCVSDSFQLIEPGQNGDPSIVANVIASRQLPASATPKNPLATTPMVDSEAAQKITYWLAMHGRQASLRGSSAVNLRDFRQGPVVIIGGINPWSLILLSNLRYSIRVDPAIHASWIQDAQDPSKRDWMIQTDRGDVDYAIITRVFDLETGRWILALGGLRAYGTQVAGDLLTDNGFLQVLPSDIQSTKNFQIVLKLNLINGSAGPPQVISFYTW